MPSGAKKRKAAKKKKVHDSSTTPTHSHQGENDGGELSSPASQDPSIEGEVVEVKRDDNSSESKSVKNPSEEEGDIEIEIGLKPKSSHGSSSSSSSGSSDDESRVVEKNVVVLESVPTIESFPEEKTHEVEDVVVDPVKPVDSLLAEVSRVYDETKDNERKDLVVEETPVVVEKQTVVVNEDALKADCQTSSVVVEPVLKENGVVNVKSPSLEEKAESEEYVASSTSAKDSISEVNGATRANNTDTDTDTVGQSDRQPPVASTPLALQKTTSWKGCCGIFELFSGSER